MSENKHSLVPLMPQHSEWACETCGAVIALDREAEDPLRWLEVHRRWHDNRAVDEAAERIFQSGILDEIAESVDGDGRDAMQDAVTLARLALGTQEGTG